MGFQSILLSIVSEDCGKTLPTTPNIFAVISGKVAVWIHNKIKSSLGCDGGDTESENWSSSDARPKKFKPIPMPRPKPRKNKPAPTQPRKT